MDRFGTSLALVVLAAFAAAVALAVALPVLALGGPGGWVGGIAVGVGVVHVLRRPTGGLVGGLVDRGVR